jgi:TRAP-type C4-dicarboxylate transport system permease small subunit
MDEEYVRIYVMFVMLRSVIEENYKVNIKIVVSFIPTRKVKPTVMYAVCLYFLFTAYCLLATWVDVDIQWYRW